MLAPVNEYYFTAEATAEAVLLLKLAADSLQDHHAAQYGDSNNALAMDIYRFLRDCREFGEV